MDKTDEYVIISLNVLQQVCSSALVSVPPNTELTAKGEPKPRIWTNCCLFGLMWIVFLWILTCLGYTGFFCVTVLCSQRLSRNDSRVKSSPDFINFAEMLNFFSFLFFCCQVSCDYPLFLSPSASACTVDSPNLSERHCAQRLCCTRRTHGFWPSISLCRPQV